MEYRPIPDDREDEFRSIVEYAFSPESGPSGPDDEVPDPATLGEPRGLFEEDALRSVCKQYWFDARVRGDRHPLAGLSAVATPPEHRRRGFVRRLITESLEEYRDRGFYLAALWPFDHSFYAAFGWETANTFVTHECPPDVLRVERDHSTGEFSRLDPDDHERLATVLEAHGERYELAVDRTEEWWRKRVFRGSENDPYVYGWTRDGGLRGYVVFRIVEGDDGRLLRADDVAWIDHEARLACLELLANHDSQVDRIRLYGPDDTTLLDLVEDPGEVETDVSTGPMIRIVDVPAALEALTYPSSVEGAVGLRVEDPIVGGNDATVELTIADGLAIVDETDVDPEVTVGIGTLSQLYVGYRPVETLERVGELSIADPDARVLLQQAFPPRDVLLREGF